MRGLSIWAFAIFSGVKTPFDLAVAASFSARTGNISETPPR
jgi:hypothetical protein